MTDTQPMDDAAIVDLRKPFPPESVGKLPKGGQLLDYVGHAAVTDRLLTVDPFWSWEPFATDERGLPALDDKGNLWIRLTVRGMTRIGVGDGTSVKEKIGDAIRNAAMRFGVALDLWAKEQLVEFALAVQGHAADTPRGKLDEALGNAEKAKPHLTKAQNTKIQMLANQLGLSREQKLAGLSQIAGRDIASTNDLTSEEASLALDSLQAKVDAKPKAAGDE